MGETFPAELVGARPILETAPLAILAVDRTGRISWANGRLEEMFRYLPGQVVVVDVDVGHRPVDQAPEREERR